MKNLKEPFIYFVFATLFAFTPVDTQGQTTSQRVRLLSGAFRAYEARDLQAARYNLEELLRTDPDHPEVIQLFEALNKDLAAQGMPTVKRPTSSSAPVTAKMPTMASSLSPRPGVTSAPPITMAATPSPRHGAAVRASGGFGFGAGVTPGALSIQRPALTPTVVPAGPPAIAQPAAPPAGQTQFGAMSRSSDVGRTTFTQAPRPGQASPRPGQASPRPTQAALRPHYAQPASQKSSYSSGGGNFERLLRAKAKSQQAVIKQARKDIQTALHKARTGNITSALHLLTDTQKKMPVNMATLSVLEDIQGERIIMAIEILRLNKTGPDRDLVGKMIDEYKEMFDVSTRYYNLRAMATDAVSDPRNLSIKEISPEYIESQEKARELIIKARAQYLHGDEQGAMSSLRDAEAYDYTNMEAKGMQRYISEQRVMLSIIFFIFLCLNEFHNY